MDVGSAGDSTGHAAQCGLRAGQRPRQEIGELVRVRGRDWASVVVARMVSEVVLEQGQEQQGQEQQGSAENAAQGGEETDGNYFAMAK